MAVAPPTVIATAHNAHNARLIASAPALVEALEAFLECSACENGCAPDDMTCATSKARAALAAARGEAGA